MNEDEFMQLMAKLEDILNAIRDIDPPSLTTLEVSKQFRNVLFLPI